MDDRELDERIANVIDAEYIVKQFGLLDEKQKEELAQDISRFMYDRQAALRSPKNTYTPRFLWQGQDINHADTGRKLPVGHAGPTVPRIVNLESGFLANLTQNDPQQLNIRSAGAGADCLFDYLVSPCFATLNGFTEGQTFTSLSGCTFKGFSTVTGMVAQAFTDFGASAWATAAICSGTYLETNIAFSTNQYMRWYGTGRNRVIIGTTSSVTTDTVAMATGARLQCSQLEIRASTHASSTKGGVNVGGSGWLIAEDCIFAGRSVSTSDTAQFGILGNSSAQVFLTDCELQKNGFYGGNEGVAQFVGVYHSGGGLGIRAFNNTLISGCFFDASALGVSQCRTNVQITGCHFENCTTGVTTTSSVTHWLTIENNHFDFTTTALDFSDGGGYQCYGWYIAGNKFNNSSSKTFIKWPASSTVIFGKVAFNYSDGVGTFSSGTLPQGIAQGPNYEGNGHARTDNIGSGLDGIVQIGAGTDFKTVQWNAFVVYFGATRVTATAGSNTYATNDTYYISCNSSGVVTATTTGGFPSGEFPMATVTTNAQGTILTCDWYDGYLRTTSSGAAPAPADEPFITHAASANLSDERVLAPQSAYTPVGGVGFINSGSDGGDITGTLKDLTANWTQAGVFDISTAGNLTVLKHMAVGSTATLSTSQIISAADTFTNPGNIDAILNQPVHLLTANTTATGTSAHFNNFVVQGGATGTWSNTAGGSPGSFIGINAQDNLVLFNKGAATAISADRVTVNRSRITVNTGTSVTDAYVKYIGPFSGASRITNLYGLYIENVTGAATLNRAIYSAGGDSVHGGNFTIGGTAAPNTTLDVRGAVTLDGVSAPSTPASDDLVVYNETGTKLLKAKDDAGAVYNLTKTYEVSASVDGTVTTQLTPIRCNSAGTVVGAYCKTADAKTTSTWRGDIYKVLVANVNTDGGTTTILSAPFGPSGGGMAATATLSGTPTVAVGDYLVFATTTADASVTFVSMVAEIRPT